MPMFCGRDMVLWFGDGLERSRAVFIKPWLQLFYLSLQKKTTPTLLPTLDQGYKRQPSYARCAAALDAREEGALSQRNGKTKRIHVEHSPDEALVGSDKVNRINNRRISPASIHQQICQSDFSMVH